MERHTLNQRSERTLASKVAELIIQVLVTVANAIYSCIKLLPSRNKVTFISRQQDSVPIDFKLLIKTLRERDETGISITVLTKTLGYGFLDKIRYIPHIFRQMYHIATSRIVVLDSYSIPVCILHHKKSLMVVQLWHGLGSFKKFAYSIIDKPEFQTSYVPVDGLRLAKIMHLHENYDVIISSNAKSALDFAEAFNSSPERIKVISLPRVDLLTDMEAMDRIRHKIFDAHPELKRRKTILYAPTFRRGRNVVNQINELINSVDFDEYNLVVKLHAVSDIHITDQRLINVPDYTAMELLAVSDFVVTDYSAIVYEAYLTDTPVFFYQFDESRYVHDRGVYTPLSKFPSKRFTDPHELMQAIETTDYSLDEIHEFIDEQVTFKHGNSARLADFFIKHLKEEAAR